MVFEALDPVISPFLTFKSPFPSLRTRSMHLSAESEESLDQWLDYLELLPEMQILEKPGYVPRSTFGKLASDISGGSRRFPKEVTFAGGKYVATVA